MRCGREMAVLKSQLSMISKCWEAVSEKLSILSYWDFNAEVLETLDKMPSRRNGLHDGYTIHELQLEKLVRKPNQSEMHRIYIFALLISLTLRNVDHPVCKKDAKHSVFAESPSNCSQTVNF